MLRVIGQLLLAWGLWGFLQRRYGQVLFGALGMGLVWYGASEAEKYLLLTEKTDYLAVLLVIKNAGYGIVLFIFLLWPFIFRGEKKQKRETPRTINALKPRRRKWLKRLRLPKWKRGSTINWERRNPLRLIRAGGWRLINHLPWREKEPAAQSPQQTKTHPWEDEKAPPSGDGFDHIRERGFARSEAEIKRDELGE